MIDSHAHLELLENPEEKIKAAFEQGIECIVTVIDPSEDWERAVRIVDKFERIYFCAGVHPHNARVFDSEKQEILVSLLSHRKAIAVGELGLDYHYMNSSREAQLNALEIQLEIAKNLNKPVVVHSRSAFEETAAILEKRGFLNEKTLFHCFSEDSEKAVFLASRGCYLSFAGNMTYPKAENIRLAFKSVPLEKIVFETDCPFLSPQPRRGRKNEPAFVKYLYDAGAELRKVERETLATLVRKNFNNFFKVLDE